MTEISSSTIAQSGEPRHWHGQAAAIGGHQHQRVTARYHMVDDGLLRATKAGVAKNRLQNGFNGQFDVLLF